jgi:hypothetical protein
MTPEFQQELSPTVGSEVTKFVVGAQGGVGCMVDSCGECVNCHKGDERARMARLQADLDQATHLRTGALRS